MLQSEGWVTLVAGTYKLLYSFDSATRIQIKLHKYTRSILNLSAMDLRRLGNYEDLKPCKRRSYILLHDNILISFLTECTYKRMNRYIVQRYWIYWNNGCFRQYGKLLFYVFLQQYLKNIWLFDHCHYVKASSIGTLAFVAADLDKPLQLCQKPMSFPHEFFDLFKKVFLWATLAFFHCNENIATCIIEQSKIFINISEEVWE